MVSDGIVDAGKNNDFGENWLIYFLKKLNTNNPKEIANQILDRALELQLGAVDDDMTVLVTKVISNWCININKKVWAYKRYVDKRVKIVDNWWKYKEVV